MTYRVWILWPDGLKEWVPIDAATEDEARKIIEGRYKGRRVKPHATRVTAILSQTDWMLFDEDAGHAA